MSEYEGKWITASEAARIIGIARKSVNKAARKGKLKAIKNDDGGWMIDKDSAEAYAGRDDPFVMPDPNVTFSAPDTKMQDTESAEWLMRAVSLMTPDEARMMARKVLEATVSDPAARLLIERHI